MKSVYLRLGCVEIGLQIACGRSATRRIRRHWIGSRQCTERLRRQLMERITRQLAGNLRL